MTILHWSGGPVEWTGKRGNRIIALVVLETDGYAVYDQRSSETPERPDKLEGLLDTLEKAQDRTAGWWIRRNPA